MKTLEIALGIFGWFFIGWLFANLKVKYWYNHLIKNDNASKYYDFESAPIKVWLPIFLIWPIQATVWVVSEYKDNQEDVIPITPLGCQYLYYGNRIRSNINFAILFDKSTYWDNSDDNAKEINKDEYIKMQFGACTLAGGFHLLFWALGISLIVFVETLFLGYLIGKGLVKLLSFTYTPVEEIPKK